MPGPIRSLIIKEWHEQKWRCASLSAIGLSVVVFTMLREPTMTLVVSMAVSIALAILGTVFIAMGIAAGERSSGTLELLRALPVPMPKVTAVKLVAGMITGLTPVLLVLAATSAWQGLLYLLAAQGHEASAAIVKINFGMNGEINEYRRMVLFSIACTVNMYLWFTAVGVTQKTELRAGLVGIAVAVTWFMVIALTAWLTEIVFGPYRYLHPDDRTIPDLLFACIFGISPYGAYLAVEDYAGQFWTFATAQATTLCLLTLWVLYRFGRMTRHDNASPAMSKNPAGSRQLARPRYAPITAIAWKQWRDMAPMVALGLLVIAVFVADSVMNSFVYRDKPDAIEQVRSSLVYWIGYESRTIGILLALVVGVGTFVGDYRAAALTFWRSRPISPRLWFWSKYLTGLLVVELTMITPWLIAQVATGNHDMASSRSGYMGAVFVLYWFIYTVSVFMACFLRHTVYAGIMAAGVVAAILIPPLVEPYLKQFSVETVLNLGNGVGFNHWLAGYFLPYLLWMLPPTLLGLWLATRAAKRESAFVFGR